MQVRGGRTRDPTAPKGKDEVGTSKARSGRKRFSTLLQSQETPSEVAAAQVASAEAFGGRFRFDGERPPAIAPVAVSPARAVERILVGTNEGGAEARIRIGGGLLAGTELSLWSQGGRLVEAALLTCAAGSRQTLLVALEEIRVRLRGRGIVLAQVAGQGASRRGR